jgi:hypothetical protein
MPASSVRFGSAVPRDVSGSIWFGFGSDCAKRPRGDLVVGRRIHRDWVPVVRPPVRGKVAQLKMVRSLGAAGRVAGRSDEREKTHREVATDGSRDEGKL